LSEEIHALKVKMNDKNEEIVELQKRVSRLTSENTGFQRIISMYDTRQDINVSDDAETVILRKRINELEQIINEQKKAANDSGDLKLVNDQVFHLQQVRFCFIVFSFDTI
jgi:predicted RNase H-like nuclease (RuvC/YqgF family)